MFSTMVEDVLSANSNSSHHSGSWKIRSMGFFYQKTFVFQIISTTKHPTNTFITPRNQFINILNPKKDLNQ